MAEKSEKLSPDILGLLDHYGISYPKEMEHPQICCLYHHDPNPSMTFYPETNSFYCFGCHKSGDAVTLVMKMENCSLHEAKKIVLGDGYEWYELRAKAEKTVDIDFTYMYTTLAQRIKKKLHASVDDQQKLDKLRGLILKYMKETLGPNQLLSCLMEINKV